MMDGARGTLLGGFGIGAARGQRGGQRGFGYVGGIGESPAAVVRDLAIGSGDVPMAAVAGGMEALAEWRELSEMSGAAAEQFRALGTPEAEAIAEQLASDPRALVQTSVFFGGIDSAYEQMRSDAIERRQSGAIRQVLGELYLNPQFSELSESEQAALGVGRLMEYGISPKEAIEYHRAFRETRGEDLQVVRELEAAGYRRGTPEFEHAMRQAKGLAPTAEDAERLSLERGRYELERLRFASEQGERAMKPPLEPSEIRARRKEFLDASQRFELVKEGWQGLLSNIDLSYGGNRQAQLAALYSVVRIYDPGSVVKEGEIQLSGQAGNLPERFLRWVTQFNRGDRLTTGQLDELRETAEGLFVEQRKSQLAREQRYREAQRAEGVPEDLDRAIVMDLLGPFRDDVYGGRPTPIAPAKYPPVRKPGRGTRTITPAEAEEIDRAFAERGSRPQPLDPGDTFVGWSSTKRRWIYRDQSGRAYGLEGMR
jgi:hypothetical protein